MIFSSRYCLPFSEPILDFTTDFGALAFRQELIFSTALWEVDTHVLNVAIAIDDR